MALAAGTRLGSYEIVAPIGSGGMGEVYRSRDAKLDRDVAIKVLPATVADDADALSRFEREAKAVAALSHPNILAIYDFGRQGGIAYAVTELLDGETLRGKLDSGPIPLRQATDYSLQIVKGLSAAHGRGIVHRDLKPDNVFVTKDGHVKILDFGLAKRVDDTRPDEQTSAPTGTGHTQPGTVMGTMGYMSPEQLRGLPVDHRSDIFSFGALLYEILSGRKAFRRDTASDTIAAILKEEPPELTGTGRAIPPALDHVVRHCLEKQPDDRFQSAKDVAFALNEASGSTTMTTTSGVHVVATAAPRGKRWMAVVAAAVLVAIAAAVLLTRRAPQRAAGGVRRIAVLPFENLGAPEDDYFADGMADEIRGKLTSLPGVQVIARGSSTPYKKTSKTPKQIAEELNVEYLLTATVRSEKSGGASRVQVRPELVDVSQRDAPTSKWQQTFDSPLNDVFQVQTDIASRVAEALGVALGASREKQLAERPTENLAAYQAFLKGVEVGGSRVDAPTLRQEAAHYEQAVALDPGFAQAWAAMAVSDSLLYALAPTPALAERTRFAAEKAMALAPNEPESYRALGFYKRGVLLDHKAALAEFERGLRVAPGNVNLMRNAANTEMFLGRWDAALEHMQKVAHLDPRSAANQSLLTLILVNLRRFPEARASAQAALALAPDDPQNLLLLVLSWIGEGNLEAAKAAVADAVRTREPTEVLAWIASQDLPWALPTEQQQIVERLTPASFDNNRGTWGFSLATILWLRGNTAESRKYAEEARQAFEEQLRSAPESFDIHVFLSVALGFLGRTADGLRAAQRALELASNSTQTPQGHYYLARIEVLAGQPEKAVDSLERLLRMPCYISAGYLRIDPNFAALRSDPRFQKLVQAGK